MFKKTATAPSKEGLKAPAGRVRKLNMNMHVSEEEKEMIDDRVALSGLSKRDFCVQSLMHQKVVCLGNIRVTSEMQRQLCSIEKRLLETESSAELDVRLLEKLRMILELLNAQNADAKFEYKDFVL